MSGKVRHKSNVPIDEESVVQDFVSLPVEKSNQIKTFEEHLVYRSGGRPGKKERDGKNPG